MNLQELFEKWIMIDRDTTPLWRLAINEIEYELTEDPSDGVEIAALAENIRQCGLIHPILVERQSKGKKYRLVSGRRRLEATQLLGRTHISAILVKSGCVPSLKLALSENMMRKEPHFLDQTADIERLLKEIPISEAAKLFSVKEDTIREKLKLTVLSPYEKRLIRMLGISEKDALALCAIENSSYRKLLLEKMMESGENCDRAALIARAVHSTDPRITQSEKICVRDIRVFLNTVERAAEMMKSAGFDTDIQRIDNSDQYCFTITVSKAQYAPLKKAIADAHKHKQSAPHNVSRETSQDSQVPSSKESRNVSRETSEIVAASLDETVKA